MNGNGNHQALKAKGTFMENGAAPNVLDFAGASLASAIVARPSRNGKRLSENGLRNDAAVASVLARVDWPVVTRELGLSHQEIAVVKHVMAGEKMANIAGDLCLSLGTVKTYCQRIYRKLQVSDHCGLAIVVLGCARLREVRDQSVREG